jgi:hypothetical protein
MRRPQGQHVVPPILRNVRKVERRRAVEKQGQHARQRQRHFLQALARDVSNGAGDRPNQIWVADLTYVAIPSGFV